MKHNYKQSLSLRDKTWIEINKNNLFWNLKQIKKTVGEEVKVLAVVKANAYGHGLVEVVSLLNNKVDFFGVDNIDEALKIRSLKIQTPILVLGYIPFERLIDATNNNISVCVYNFETLEIMNNLDFKKPLKVHLKIETGMHRQGIDLKDLQIFIKKIIQNKNLSIEGIYSHLSDPGNINFTENQLLNFQKAVEISEELGFSKIIKHISASGGISLDHRFHLDMVRAGISLYGYVPYSLNNDVNSLMKTKPVLSWKSVIAQIKDVEKDQFVGYGLTWKAKKKTKIAIIPIGYYDGYDRRFSNCGRVILNGKFSEIVGRVAMNMIMINLEDQKNIKVGDEITLIGADSDIKIDADNLAEKIGTINHEILARLNYLIPKIVV